MDVRLITENGVERRKPDEIEALLEGPALLWIDVAHWDAHTEEILGERLNLIRGPCTTARCATRCPRCTCTPITSSWCCTPRSAAPAGTCTTSSWTSSSGTNWLLTVHGPMNPVVPLEAAYVETGAPQPPTGGGRLRPVARCELSAAIVDRR